MADNTQASSQTPSSFTTPNLTDSGTMDAPPAPSFITAGTRPPPQPVFIVAENFAPGTSAADIKLVMGKFGRSLFHCELTATKPSVIARLAFLDRAGAENVVAVFDGKKVRSHLLA